MAGAQLTNEYEVKAAFLYKFASFVEWPAESGSPRLCIAVVGQDPFGPLLEEVVKGKAINGRGFQVRRVKVGQDLAACQIAFISASEKPRLRTVLERFQGSSILTVSDLPDFCEDGGMIGLQTVERKIRIEINLEAAERSGIRLSSKLLGVARIVRSGSQK